MAQAIDSRRIHDGRARRRASVAIGFALTVLGITGGLRAADDQPPALPPALPEDGPAYAIDRFTIRYFHGGHPDQPRREDLMELEVEVARAATGFVAPRAGLATEMVRLADVASRPPEPWHASAIQQVLVRVHAALADHGLIGVWVAPDPEDIAPGGEDLRPERRRALRILVTTALVSEVRTLAAGDRIPAAERINHPAHAPIAARSPLRPSDEGDRRRRDLLRRDVLDAYAFALSRHPGRRVDVALAPGAEPGTVTLDYLVAENRPLALYAQISNIGTRSTDTLRERFGLVHSQLTGRDDILTIDYSTASFDEVHALSASYEMPFGLFGEDLRLRLAGGLGSFTASELGAFADTFTGDSWSFGGELIGTVYQHRDLFLDLFAGLRIEHIAVNNQAIGVAGDEDFILPRIGLRLEQQRDTFSLLGSLFVEWNDGQDPAPDPAQLNRLGRIQPDPHFGVLRWDLRAAAHLEPLLDRAAWEAGEAALVHEVAVAFRGQYAFGNRLVPQFQQVVGGLASVRGYPESVAAGDGALVASVEYHFHVPLAAVAAELTPEERFGEPLRRAPASVYGRPDQDLFLRAFFDAGRTFVSDALFFERNETLLGAGVGVDFTYQRRLSCRLDWGFALSDVEAAGVDAGSSRLHFLVSLFF